jgi:hypothetical protein
MVRKLTEETKIDGSGHSCGYYSYSFYKIATSRCEVLFFTGTRESDTAPLTYKPIVQYRFGMVAPLER